VASGSKLIAQPVFKPLPDGYYYLVRHAEKDTGADPALTKAGYLRSGDLYRFLKNKKIGKIYTNQYRRIQLTADSLRIYQKIDTVHYLADLTGDDLFQKLTGLKKAVSILIIGHSNTIPVIIKRLGVTGFDLKEIPENEFDNLYFVKIKNRKASLKRLKYGKASPVSTKPGVMKPL
jgi:phosphohistidine phosphatase SixA